MFAIAAVLLAASAARAEELRATFTAADVAKLIAAKGHQHEVSTDSAGDPIVTARNPLIAHDYQVLFYNCREGACEAVQLRTWFKHTAPISAEQMNAWNSAQTFGRAFLDSDGDPTLDVFIYAHSGVPLSYLGGELTYFLKVMRDFRAAFADSIEP